MFVYHNGVAFQVNDTETKQRRSGLQGNVF